MICGDLFQDPQKALFVGIGDKDLAELVLGYQADDLLHPARIKFIKDIIQ